MPETFVKGDEVHLKKKSSVISLSANVVYTIGAVRDLPEPNKHYVESRYWDNPEWSWARGKTRLEVAGHPQIVFLDGELRPEMEIQPVYEDPDGEGRSGFSGAWFEKVAG